MMEVKISYEGAIELISNIETELNYILEVEFDVKLFYIEGNTKQGITKHNIENKFMMEYSIKQIMENSDKIVLKHIEKEEGWDSSSIEKYFNEWSYGIQVKELWDEGDKKYYAVRESSPSGTPTVFNIYVKDNAIYNENGENILMTNLEMI